MYKKIALGTLSLFLLAGCSTATEGQVEKEASKPNETTTETKPETKTLTGEAKYESGETVKATILKEGENISDVLIETIDTDGNAVTQIAQMSDPATQDTAIPTEYAEQVAYLEDWIKANGTADIQTDENGKAVDTALLEGCDINIAPIMEAVNNALANEAND